MFTVISALPAPILGEPIRTGFVTQIVSPQEFYVGSLHVVLNGDSQCAIQKFHSDIQLKARQAFLPDRYFQLQSRPVPKSESTVACDVLPIRVGSRVEVAGSRKWSDGGLTAAQVVVYKMDIQRRFHTSWKPLPCAVVARLEEQPNVTRAGRTWIGSLWLDGYPMKMGPDTKRLAHKDLHQMAIGPFYNWLLLHDDAVPRPNSHASSVLASPIQSNTWVAYQGTRHADGHVFLDRFEAWPDQLFSGCQSMLAKILPTIDMPNYASQKSGAAVFPQGKARPKNVGAGHWNSEALKILPDRRVQGYISRLGTSLIPQYQATAQQSKSAEVGFRFYVVQDTGPAFDDEVNNVDSIPYSDWLGRPSLDDAVLALPNGMIFVPTSSLAKLQSESQLAAILSSGIASVLQRQSCIAAYEISRHANGFAYDSFSAVTNTLDLQLFTYGFVLWRNEQALRIGIRQMYLAGYDIREAPYAWAVAQGKPVNNPVIDSKHPDKEIPWYAAYAFNYISQYYPDADYSKLKRGEKEYQQFLHELRKADPAAFAPQQADSKKVQTTH
jgi:hypothetical protein